MNTEEDHQMLRQLDRHRASRTNFISNGFIYAQYLRRRDRHTIIRSLCSTIAYTYNEMSQYEEQIARKVWLSDVLQNTLAKTTDPELIEKYQKTINQDQKEIIELENKIHILEKVLDKEMVQLTLRQQSSHVLKRSEVTEPDPV